MQPLDFAKEYQNKTDEELLRLASVSHQLTEDAKRALSGALLSRGIDSDEVKENFHREEVQAERRRGRRVGRLAATRGIGRQRYGKANYSLNQRTRMERFTTTIFVVLFWLPLIPTGTYRVQRKKQLLSSDMVVLEKLPPSPVSGALIHCHGEIEGYCESRLHDFFAMKKNPSFLRSKSTAVTNQYRLLGIRR
jgi:hypothetical protein